MAKSQKKEDLIQGTGSFKKHTLGTPKYDPDAHLDRRKKDIEKLKSLLQDLVVKELKKLSK